MADEIPSWEVWAATQSADHEDELAPFHRCPSLRGCPYCDNNEMDRFGERHHTMATLTHGDESGVDTDSNRDFDDLTTRYEQSLQGKNGSVANISRVKGSSVWDWSLVDAVICICLRERDDRLAESAEQFHRVGLCRHVIYYRPLRPSKDEIKRLGVLKGGAYGCWESHRFATRTAREKWGVERLLIFEDDVQFVDDFTPEMLSRIGEQIDNLPDNWDIFYLGHFPVFGYWQNWSPPDMLLGDLAPASQWRTWSFMTHAYVQNAAQMDRVIQNSYVDVQRQSFLYRLVDPEIEYDAWNMFTAKQYAAFPMIAYQSQSPTSNAKTGLLAHGKFNDWVIQQHTPYHRSIEKTALVGLPAAATVGALTLLVIVGVGVGYLLYSRRKGSTLPLAPSKGNAVPLTRADKVTGFATHHEGSHSPRSAP
jgi:hypothetical protein